MGLGYVFNKLKVIHREGYYASLCRIGIAPKIQKTQPVRTRPFGPVEVRVLTSGFDYLNVTWALKSFYHFSGTDYPLYIHDGGRFNPERLAFLRHHFPNATIEMEDRIGPEMLALLKHRGLPHCVEFRQKSVIARKILDYFLRTKAERVISLDSDILFLSCPHELIDHRPTPAYSLFNRDPDYWYCRPPEVLGQMAGTEVVPYINAGLSSIWTHSIDLQAIERWLPDLRDPDGTWPWIIEQTLHAMLASRFGVRLLPETYDVGLGRPVDKATVSRHYAGVYRFSMYTEGMAGLYRRGFIKAIR